MWWVCLLFAGVLYALCTCQKAEAQATSDSRPVTLHFQQTPFRVALHELFCQADVPYRCKPELETLLDSEDIKVTVDYKEVPFPRALDSLLRFNDGDNMSKPIGLMSYRQQKGVYVFSRGDGVREQNVTLNHMDTNLVDALKQVCSQVNVSYVLNLGQYATRHVSFPALNTPFAQAVEHLLEAAHASPDLELAVKSGTVIIGRPLPLDLSNYLPHVHPSQNMIVLCLQDENLYTALFFVCYSTGEPFLLSPASRQSRAKNMVQTASVEHVLKELIQGSTSSLKYSYKDKMIQIVEKHPSLERQW